jgi:hypothetical protein
MPDFPMPPQVATPVKAKVTHKVGNAHFETINVAKLA